jgi:heat shock protein HslJ
MRGAVALASLALLVLPACAGEDGGGSTGPSTDPADLVGVVWRLEDPSMAALADDVPDTAVVSLEFADGQVSGRSACNSYFGGYTADDDGSLSLDALGGTEMACEEPLMTLEAAYLSALGAVTSFSVTPSSGATLELVGPDTTLSFFEEVPPEPLPLIGTEWDLGSLYSGDTVSSTLAGTQVTMTLADDGTVSGWAGCNTYSGAYTLDGDVLTFGPLATTKMACADDVMAQEAAFLSAMTEVAGSAIEGTQLTLVDGSGTSLLGFVGLPAGATA